MASSMQISQTAVNLQTCLQLPDPNLQASPKQHVIDQENVFRTAHKHPDVIYCLNKEIFDIWVLAKLPQMLA